MITEVSDNIMSVKSGLIVYQANCLGFYGSRLSQNIYKKYPNVFSEYHNMCLDFKSNPEQLLGTFLSTKINNKLYVVSAMCQLDISKRFRMTDYDAWDSVCQKLSIQLELANKTTSTPWVLHIPYNLGYCGGGRPDMVQKSFKKYFGKSKAVNVVIHQS